jgi:hypothetical protein
MSSEEMIKDPGRDLDALHVLANKLESRYESDPIYLNETEVARRYGNLCDAVVQVLWADMYGTNPEDPIFHTSNPARTIARIMMMAAGLVPESKSGLSGFTSIRTTHRSLIWSTRPSSDKRMPCSHFIPIFFFSQAFIAFASFSSAITDDEHAVPRTRQVLSGLPLLPLE